MTQSPEMAGPLGSEATNRAVGPTRLMARIYRDVGLAAVASELALRSDDFESGLSESIKRGARYMCIMLKTDRSPVNG